MDEGENIKALQRHWIGRSEGSEIRFNIDGGSGEVIVFTTRPKGWASRPVGSLVKSDVIQLLECIHGRGASAASNRALAYLSKFFNWCVEQDLITVSPAARVRALSVPSSRDRVLTDNELTAISKALLTFPEPFAPLFRLLALTGQRRGEVAGMRWDELRGLGTIHAIWDIPAHRTKNGQAHLVPLNPAVQAILGEVPRTSSLVFSTNGSAPVAGFSKAKRLLHAQLTAARCAQGLPPLPPWTLHDLRRPMVSLINERLGIQPQ